MHRITAAHPLHQLVDRQAGDIRQAVELGVFGLEHGDETNVGIAEVEAAVFPTADEHAPTAVDIDICWPWNGDETILVWFEGRTARYLAMTIDLAGAPITRICRAAKCLGPTRIINIHGTTA